MFPIPNIILPPSYSQRLTCKIVNFFVQEFAGSLAITVLSGSADAAQLHCCTRVGAEGTPQCPAASRLLQTWQALQVRRDLRNDDEDEGMEAWSAHWSS